MERNDIQNLRQLPIETVAARLGLTVSRHKALCPFHADSHPSLTFSTSRNTFRCYACGAHGDTIALTMQQLGKNFRDACQWLADEHNVIITTSPTEPSTSIVKPSSFDAKRYIRFFEHPELSESARRFLFDERKLDPRVVRWCRLTSWRDKGGTNWLQIPYYDIAGRLVGIQNRNLDHSIKNRKQPRFRFPQGAKCGIYNLPVLAMLGEGEPLFITEGASDCWAMLSSGHKAIAIPSATLLGKADRQLLKDFVASHGPLNLHMYPDADFPGEKLYLDLVALANDLHSSILRHSLPPGCKDYAQWYASNHTHQ